jgi:hypothetical protein
MLTVVHPATSGAGADSPIRRCPIFDPVDVVTAAIVTSVSGHVAGEYLWDPPDLMKMRQRSWILDESADRHGEEKTGATCQTLQPNPEWTRTEPKFNGKSKSQNQGQDNNTPQKSNTLINIFSENGIWCSFLWGIWKKIWKNLKNSSYPATMALDEHNWKYGWFGGYILL